jgi:hypothetical protein
MTEFQLGNPDSARSRLSKLKRNPRINPSWTDWLLTETLRREAEDLLAAKPSAHGLKKETTGSETR